jgi:TetR/AcrR family transcriptional regulator, tetracycline repressor protein
MTDVVTPRRGRPPKLSREKIVSDVAEMLLADPSVPLTIARVADAIGTAPMSLYRHFAGREDLVVAVAHHIFVAARPPVAPDASWQIQIRTWMAHVYAQSTRVPQLVQLIAKGESPAWLADSAYLAAILADGGFGDDRAVAEAVYWVATTTMGNAMIRATAPRDFPIETLRVAIGDLDATDAAHMTRVLPHLAAIHDEGFAVAIEWTIAGLEARLAAR